MLDSSLYDISQISKRLMTLGFSVKEIASNMIQMGDKLTTVYVKKSEGSWDRESRRCCYKG